MNLNHVRGIKRHGDTFKVNFAIKLQEQQ